MQQKLLKVIQLSECLNWKEKVPNNGWIGCEMGCFLYGRLETAADLQDCIWGSYPSSWWKKSFVIKLHTFIID